MPTLTLRYSLPDEQREYDLARLGPEMAAAIREIDQRCRSLVKHAQPSTETAELATEIRQIIREHAAEALEL